MAVPYPWSSAATAVPRAKNSRPVLALVGCGGKGSQLFGFAQSFGDVAAVCDVLRSKAEAFAHSSVLGDRAGKVDVYQDYRQVLDRPDIDAVIAATPDHWHAPIYVAALRAGKHVYGEKPMTLTIDEGKILRRVLRQSDRTFQVGNQQRSCQWFREAIAIVQSGLLGSKITATCSIGSGRQGGPFRPAAPPADLDWDLWLGQAPATPYMEERYRNFRHWYDYSGGILTDWGAHHIDIAQWGIGALDTGPIEIEGEGVIDHRENCYNMPQTFRCTLTFANGNRIVVQDHGDNGILFEGEKERLFVNRGRLSGNIVEKIAADPTLRERIRDAASRLYRGPYGLADGEFRRLIKWPEVCTAHMANFFHCIRDGGKPISDVDSVQRSNTSCHLSNIAIRLARKLRWDPDKEQFAGDTEASAMLCRRQREPYAIEEPR